MSHNNNYYPNGWPPVGNPYAAPYQPGPYSDPPYESYGLQRLRTAPQHGSASNIVDPRTGRPYSTREGMNTTHHHSQVAAGPRPRHTAQSSRHDTVESSNPTPQGMYTVPQPRPAIGYNVQPTAEDSPEIRKVYYQDPFPAYSGEESAFEVEGAQADAGDRPRNDWARKKHHKRRVVRGERGKQEPVKRGEEQELMDYNDEQEAIDQDEREYVGKKAVHEVDWNEQEQDAKLQRDRFTKMRERRRQERRESQG